MKLLDVKRDIKKRKPKFFAQDAHKKSKIIKRWRKPRGTDSKMKQQLRSYRKIVKQGYMTPKEVRFVSLKHKVIGVVCATKKDIETLDPKKYGIIFKSSLGKFKKYELVKFAKEKGIIIMNLNADEFIKKYDELLKKRKSEKEEKVKEKKQKEEEKKKKSETKKKEDLSSKLTDEEKKVQDKKEKDKLLISTE